jgi:phosphoglycolate phosphatase
MTQPPPASPDRYRLLIFDWDGTLMDSIGTIVACMHATVEELGLPTLPEDAIRATIGLGLRDTMDGLYPDGDEDLYHRVVEAYRRRWLGGFSDGQTMFPGARETLATLADRGHWLAVATGKSRVGLDRDLDRTGARDLFLATRTVSESAPKPSPGMILDILDELGAEPAETLVIGDTTHDLDMAANAATPAVAVTSGSHRREELATREPLAILPGVADLPTWLQDGHRPPSRSNRTI